MQSIVPDGVQTGDVFPMLGAIVRRLVRFHLKDIVRGLTAPWKAGAIRDLEMDLMVTEVTPERVDLTLSGYVLLHEEGAWHTPPPKSSIYREGEMSCLIQERGYEANRWGATANRSLRQDDVEPAPMGIAFTLAGREARDRTPPHASPVHYFDVQGGCWIILLGSRLWGMRVGCPERIGVAHFFIDPILFPGNL